MSEMCIPHASELSSRIKIDGNVAMDGLFHSLATKAHARQYRSTQSSAATDALLHLVPEAEARKHERKEHLHEVLSRMKDGSSTRLRTTGSLTARAHAIRPFATVKDGTIGADIALSLHEDKRLDFYSAPYLGEWTSGNKVDHGSTETWADPNQGTFSFLQGAGGGSASSAAGLWVQFTPSPPLPRLVQVRAFCPYLYQWDDLSSMGYTAHSNAGFGIYVRSYDLAGRDSRVEQDYRYSTWSDGTGWFEEHNNPSWGDADDDHAFLYGNESPYFQAHPDRLYAACVWCFGSCNAGSGYFGNAISASDIRATLGFVVVGQQ
jgi:hypothetical protein